MSEEMEQLAILTDCCYLLTTMNFHQNRSSNIVQALFLAGTYISSECGRMLYIYFETNGFQSSNYLFTGKVKSH